MEEISIMPGSIRLVSANCAAGIDSKKRVHTGGGEIGVERQNKNEGGGTGDGETGTSLRFLGI